jgi:DNA-directed RNA polymerase subunit RPC12/RpoP
VEIQSGASRRTPRRFAQESIAVALGRIPSQTRDTLPKTFKCPSCTAPLEVASAATEAVRCSYCDSSVLLYDVTGEGLDWDVETGEPPSVDELQLLARISEILKRGNKIAAIKVYRSAYGTDLKSAKDEIERIERGERIVFTEQVHIIDTTHVQKAISDAARLLDDGIDEGKAFARVFLMVLVACIVLVVGSVAALFAYESWKKPETVIAPEADPSGSAQSPNVTDNRSLSTNRAVAEVVLVFGTDGIGPGQFKDARSVAVDRTGRIYAADYTGGRVQVFDPAGGFVSQWMMNPRTALHRLATDSSSVWILQAGTVSRHEPGTGKTVGTLPGKPIEWINDLAFGLDGSITIVGRSESIVRLRPDGSRVLEVRDAISGITDQTELSVKVAVDGNGDIFLLGGFHKAVFHYSADGKFLNRFGSGGDGPGQFRSPHDIAVDGQGRVYVSDTSGIHVFASDGRYLHDFAPGSEIVFGLAFDDRGDLYAACRTRVVKFILKTQV